MTELWLVRHGQTDWNLEGRYQGQSDITLNATGREQAQALARQLTGQRFDAIYSSDLLRALETAQILARALHLTMQTDPRLREIRLGTWEGMLVRDIHALYPKQVAERRSNPRDFRAPGAETAAEVADRVCAVAAEIHQRFPRGRVLLVSHGLALATLACRAKGLPLSEVYSLVADNGQPVVVEWN